MIPWNDEALALATMIEPETHNLYPVWLGDDEPRKWDPPTGCLQVERAYDWVWRVSLVDEDGNSMYAEHGEVVVVLNAAGAWGLYWWGSTGVIFLCVCKGLREALSDAMSYACQPLEGES